MDGQDGHAGKLKANHNAALKNIVAAGLAVIIIHGGFPSPVKQELPRAERTRLRLLAIPLQAGGGRQRTVYALGRA